jgi:excisionase family DNA binding protein
MEIERHYPLSQAAKPANVERLLYCRREAAAILSLSVSTIDVLISQGMLRVRRVGRRVLVPAAEIEKFSKRDVTHLWPTKVDGKTTRHVLRVERDQRKQTEGTAEQRNCNNLRPTIT